MKLSTNELLTKPWKSSMLLGLLMVPIYFILYFIFSIIGLNFLTVPMIIVVIGFVFFHLFITSTVVTLKNKLIIKTIYLFGVTEVARIFYTLLMIISYAVMTKEDIASYTICFFIFYVVTLILETMFVVNLKSQKD